MVGIHQNKPEAYATLSYKEQESPSWAEKQGECREDKKVA